MESIEFLLNRFSIPAQMLEDPMPSEENLNTILQAAVTAPDHGALRPWRFILIRGDARNQLGNLFAEAALAKDADIPEKKLEDLRKKPLRSPLIITVIAKTTQSDIAPEQEQLLSAGAAAHNILLAANALGYGSIWLTGPYAYNDHVKTGLGLESDETIVGFIYIGTPTSQSEKLSIKTSRRPNPADYTREWIG